eukprot:gene15272-21354_t
MLSLKTQRKKLMDQQKLMDMRIDNHLEIVQALLKEKKRDRALLVMKKKKLTENQSQQLGNLLFKTEEMINNIEMTKHHAKLMGVLQEGVTVLKQLHTKVAVEDVQKLMEDTAEAKAYQDELNALLGHSLGDADAEAVAAEMDLLESEVLFEEVSEMPSVPQSKVPQAAVAQAKVPTAAAEDVELELDETRLLHWDDFDIQLTEMA